MVNISLGRLRGGRDFLPQRRRERIEKRKRCSTVSHFFIAKSAKTQRCKERRKERVKLIKCLINLTLFFFPSLRLCVFALFAMKKIGDCQIAILNLSLLLCALCASAVKKSRPPRRRPRRHNHKLNSSPHSNFLATRNASLSFLVTVFFTKPSGVHNSKLI
jgi:hypothetical protein